MKAIGILAVTLLAGLVACEEKKTEMTTTAATTTAVATTTAAVPVASNPGSADNTNAANNTGINERDRNDASLTPTDQGGSGPDRDITAAVRKAVVGDGATSWDGKNVKIITQSGKVTLRGPVKSEDEKKAIEAKAKAVSGVTSIDNQLEVKK